MRAFTAEEQEEVVRIFQSISRDCECYDMSGHRRILCGAESDSEITCNGCRARAILEKVAPDRLLPLGV